MYGVKALNAGGLTIALVIAQNPRFMHNFKNLVFFQPSGASGREEFYAAESIRKGWSLSVRKTVANGMDIETYRHP
jgi:hypothetical protein